MSAPSGCIEDSRMTIKVETSKKHRQAANGDDEYLRALGERIRAERARRGMTRKILARDSGVSERYLAQLESGLGNSSIIVLRQIARAMGLPVAELVRDEPDQPVELTLLVQTLTRLSPKHLMQARKLLTKRFGSVTEPERKHRIAFIGLRGAGKSTLGARLAKHLRVPFIELDREVEHESGLRLGEIFDLYGQAAFRRYERRALENVVGRHERAVIAAGGSIVSEPATFDLLLSACYTVWLTASPEEHMSRVVAQGDFRPMADDNEAAMDDLRRILEGRDPLYSKADATVATSGRTIEQSYRELRTLLRD
jgi:XRE family transcriptional regulator, aerobic/anaerobic benzoate catabolism transcriptional regulator